jgi:hypothetical protein
MPLFFMMLIALMLIGRSVALRQDARFFHHNAACLAARFDVQLLGQLDV